MDRRPLKVRGARWAKGLAKSLAQAGVSPNSISVLSAIFALGVMLTGYYSKNNSILLITSALLIQLRLICNLLDGMVAVEHNRSSPNGELFNDVPDRFADIFIIIGASLSISTADSMVGHNFPTPLNLAWVAACLAVITAYVRVLGKSLGTESYFIGPMAKQHRMFLLTIAFIIEFFLAGSTVSGKVLYFSLVLIVFGSLITTMRRLRMISNDLMNGVTND